MGNEEKGGDPELKKKYIRHEPDKDSPDKPWVIMGKSGRVLARFPTKEAAEKGWAETMQRIHSPHNSLRGDVTELNLNDTIDAKHITSKSFIAGLKAAKTARVDLRINSEGGDILDGFAIYNAIKAHEGHVTAHIDGIAASIASVIAVAADKVCIAKNGFMMIHNGTVKTEGDPNALRQDADVLEKFCKTIAQNQARKAPSTHR